MVKHPVGEANESSPFGSLTPDEFYANHSVIHSSEYVTNSRGLKQFTQWWLPKPPAKPIALVAVVHGYTGDTSWFVTLTSTFFAESGLAVCALDHQGHGYTEGLQAHVPDINPLIDDCIEFFDEFRAKHTPGLPAFLYSESLGGAMSLHITLRQKGGWDGLVLYGAMCGIARRLCPPWPMNHLLALAAWLVPTWRLMPMRGSIPDLSFKEEWKRKLSFANPCRPKVQHPRVATAHMMLSVCQDLQGRFEEVEVPFLVVHGEEDVVCDPEFVKELYKRATSKDKTLKIYPGMRHQLVGEPQESVDLVFGDVFEWIKTRALRAAA